MILRTIIIFFVVLNTTFSQVQASDKKSDSIYLECIHRYLNHYKKSLLEIGVKPEVDIYVPIQNLLNKKDTTMNGFAVHIWPSSDIEKVLKKVRSINSLNVKPIVIEADKFELTLLHYTDYFEKRKLYSTFMGRGIYSLQFDCTTQLFKLSTIKEGEAIN